MYIFHHKSISQSKPVIKWSVNIAHQHIRKPFSEPFNAIHSFIIIAHPAGRIKVAYVIRAYIFCPLFIITAFRHNMVYLLFLLLFSYLFFLSFIILFTIFVAIYIVYCCVWIAAYTLWLCAF